LLLILIFENLIINYRAMTLTRKVEKESSPKNPLKKFLKSDKYVYLQPVCIVLNKEVKIKNKTIKKKNLTFKINFRNFDIWIKINMTY